MVTSSVILHYDGGGGLDRTVLSVLLATPPEQLREILVVNDSGDDLPWDLPDAVRVLTNQERVGQAESRNRAATMARGDVLVFLGQAARPMDGWLGPLAAAAAAGQLAGPSLYGLDTNLWSATPAVASKYSWRWDLNTYPAADPEPAALCLTDACMAVGRGRFGELGGFDRSPGMGEELEFSMRNWLCGGSVAVVAESAVATPLRAPQVDSATAIRIAETWFGGLRSRFYDSRHGLAGVDAGDITKIHRTATELQTRDVSWLVERFMPELGRVYDLKQRYHGKSVAVVCDGPSLDLVDRWSIARHDLVIGVDYAATVFDCDYAMALDHEPARALLTCGRYRQEQLVLPTWLVGADGFRPVSARGLAPRAVLYELGQQGVAQPQLDPPFTNFGHPLLAAVQLAAFCGAASVHLYGWDGKMVGGRSHTSLVGHYNGGKYWDDGQHAAGRFEHYSLGLRQLTDFLAGRRVPVLRTNLL